ncbi:acetyl-CoA carboxylase biotin carboxylase subunit [bacterium]|nr:acetyl-CoA carboxylase biotin carboxylase subunit [bacterium]
MIKKIFIPNRGEIAVRIIRACRELGIISVAAYSQADRTSLHVQIADEAIEIGPPPALESYLNIENVVKAAKESGADAIHPGYGFLAENKDFAAKCRDNGLIFIGPTPESMELVGDKVASRVTVQAAGVPIIPGMLTPQDNISSIITEAKKIGYPVLVKASMGGGGKGMQIVTEECKLKECIEASKRIAKSAFGDDTVYVEKYIEKPRHVEIQVIADHHGNAVHLFERECSIQRRHQKVIEESPSPAINEDIRRKMGDTAVRVVKETGYTNAGTVEFLLDQNRNFYFLEVNARVQVEHPVTEWVTGIDIVKEQIRIANGEPLSFSQEQIRHVGHAIETRIYAEDPEANFIPSPGRISVLREPVGPGIRVDSGIYEGYIVPSFYDPILSKLIVYDSTREKAIERAYSALSSYLIGGIKTIIPFLLNVLRHPEFRSGNLSTSFIQDYQEELFSYPEEEKIPFAALAAYGIYSSSARGPNTPGLREAGLPGVWDTLGGWKNTE